MRWLSLFAVVLVLGVARGEDPKKADPKKDDAKKERYEMRDRHDPDGIGKFYLDREIAHVMGFQAAGWLERSEREKEEEPAKLLKALDIKPGMVIADVGAGSGYHVFRMAPLVGDKGKILAVDIQPQMLTIVNNRAKQAGVKNVETVKSTEKDPKLTANSVDLIMMVDVYHEFSYPYEMTEKMVTALKPGGRLVFVEFRLEDPMVPIKLVHKMSERQMLKEMSQFAELEHSKTISTLPWQHIIVFSKKGKK